MKFFTEHTFINLKNMLKKREVAISLISYLKRILDSQRSLQAKKQQMNCWKKRKLMVFRRHDDFHKPWNSSHIVHI